MFALQTKETECSFSFGGENKNLNLDKLNTAHINYFFSDVQKELVRIRRQENDEGKTGTLDN